MQAPGQAAAGQACADDQGVGCGLRVDGIVPLEEVLGYGNPAELFFVFKAGAASSLVAPPLADGTASSRSRFVLVRRSTHQARRTPAA